MTNLQSKYPIGQLLIAALEQSRQRLPGFVSAIGFMNTNKGIRHFRTALTSGIAAPALINRLATSQYAPSPEALNDALCATEELLNKERVAQIERERSAIKERFRPYIAPLTELQRPSSITIFALLGGFERLTIALPPSFPTWQHDLQLRFAQSKIRSHYRRLSGLAPMLGAITGYRLVRALGEPALCFTIDGQVAETTHDLPATSVCGLTTQSGRPAHPSLFTGTPRASRRS